MAVLASSYNKTLRAESVKEDTFHFTHPDAIYAEMLSVAKPSTMPICVIIQPGDEIIICQNTSRVLCEMNVGSEKTTSRLLHCITAITEKALQL